MNVEDRYKYIKELKDELNSKLNNKNWNMRFHIEPSKTDEKPILMFNYAKRAKGTITISNLGDGEEIKEVDVGFTYNDEYNTIDVVLRHVRRDVVVAECESVCFVMDYMNANPRVNIIEVCESDWA